MVWYRFGAFVLDVDLFQLRRADETLPVQPKVLDVLRYLIEQRGRMVAKSELLDQLWPGEPVNESVVSWSVSHVRRALGQQPSDKQPIETVHGRGYRFTAEVSSFAAPESAPASSESRAPVLVGRERAMEELLHCVQEAAAGRGKLCLITGESGIGKTRCASDLARRATALGVRTLAGRCPQAPGTPPLWPIDAALSPLADDIAVRARQLIAGLGEQGESREASGDEGARFRTIEGVVRSLHDLAAARPTLLTLDDIHWADASTLQLLGFIAPELADLPLCVVATLRDSELEPGGPRDRALLQVRRYARTIPLGSLSSGQVGELIAALSGRQPSAELAEAVHRASGGIPLFVQEAVRSLLSEYGGAFDQLRTEAVPIPALARDVLRGRIRQLPEPTHDLLSRAAVIGESFELSLLAALLELDHETLLDRLAPGIAEGLLESEAPHVYRFAHSLFQSVLYDDLPAGQRVTIHRKLGELLDARTGGEARKGELARHYFRSLAAGDHEAVMRRARDAAEAALRAFAFEEAVLYFSWALEAQDFTGVAEPRARAELLLALASAQRSAGRTGDSTDTATRVIELAQQHRMHDLVVGATRRRRPTVALASVPDRLTRSALELVLRQLPDSSDPVRISALSQLACVPPYERDLASSKEWSARAVALAEQQADREVLFEALRARLFSLSGPDDVDAVLQVADRMLALESTGARSWQTMDARVARFSALLLAGRIADADATLSETAAALRGPHWGEAVFYCQRMHAQRRFLDGHFEDAEQLGKRVYSQALRAGVSYADTLRDAQALNLELEREGPQWVVDKYLRRTSAPLRLPRPIRAGRARIAAEAGELTLVRTELTALGDPGDYPRDGSYLHTLASFAVCAVALDDKARCEQLLGLLAPYAGLNTPDAMGYYLGSVGHFLGLLHAALGKPSQARNDFERALEHNRAMGYRAGVVRTLMALAELERRLGRAARARDAFRAARDVAYELGMRSAVALADSALAQG